MKRSKIKGGSIANSILANLDLDDPNLDPATAIYELEARRLAGLGNVETAENELLRPVRNKRERILNRLETKFRPPFEIRRYDYDLRRDTLKKWLDLGLAQRLMVISLPSLITGLILFGMASFDFLVFARTIAVFSNQPDYSLPFFIGGLIGLIISVLAFLLARVMKKGAVRRVQGELVSEKRSRKIWLSGEENDLTPFPSGTRLSLVLSGVLASALILSFLMRLDAGAETNISYLVFQISIPLVIVIFEYLIFDPFGAPVLKRKWSHWRDERKLTKFEASERRIRERALAMRGNVERMFDSELARMAQLLQRENVRLDAETYKRASEMFVRSKVSSQSK
jgi:hypothetical protein